MGIGRKGRLWEVLRWKLFYANAYSQYLDDQPTVSVNVDWACVKSDAGLSITFLKHAGVLIQDQGCVMLIDPVFNGIFGFIRDYTPLGFDLADMPRPDHVLITHGHYDHLDKPSLKSLPRDTHVISPLGYQAQFEDIGMTRRDQLDWYDSYVDGQREIVLAPANHWTMRNPIVGPNRSLWGGYVIRTAAGATIYVSGDSAYFDGFDQIGNDFDIDLAIINLSAYEPRWFMAPSHISPVETVDAFQELGAKKLMIVHWGTFRLGDEPVHFPPQDLRRELERAKLLDRWLDVRHGQTVFM